MPPLAPPSHLALISTDWGRVELCTGSCFPARASRSVCTKLPETEREIKLRASLLISHPSSHSRNVDAQPKLRTADIVISRFCNLASGGGFSYPTSPSHPDGPTHTHTNNAPVPTHRAWAAVCRGAAVIDIQHRGQFVSCIQSKCGPAAAQCGSRWVFFIHPNGVRDTAAQNLATLLLRLRPSPRCCFFFRRRP